MLALGATTVGLDVSEVLGVRTSGALGVVLVGPSGWCVVFPPSKSIRPNSAIMPSAMGVYDGVLAIGTCGGE